MTTGFVPKHLKVFTVFDGSVYLLNTSLYDTSDDRVFRAEPRGFALTRLFIDSHIFIYRRHL